MKDWLIKILGGYTKVEYQEKNMEGRLIFERTFLDEANNKFISYRQSASSDRNGVLSGTGIIREEVTQLIK